MNAEGRFLAHWDEFVDFRKEVQTKFEEAFELAQERREAGLRLTRLCQQLETKVERISRQAKEQGSRSETVEDRINVQVKGLESCKEGLEVLREKITRHVQDLNTSMGSVRSDFTEDAERRQQGLLEAIRRGDRCLAEEFMRKNQESSDKLSGNLQTLEEALATFVRQTRIQLADLGDQIEAKAKEHATELKEKSAESASQLEASMSSLREELAVSATRAEVSEGVLGDQASRLAVLEAKLSKLQDSFARAEGRASASEEAEQQRAEQLSERLGEVSEHCEASITRLRSEALQAVAAAASGVRDDFREELRSLRESMRETMLADIQVSREEYRAGFASALDREQSLKAELSADVSAAAEDSRTNGRELLALLEAAMADAKTEKDSVREIFAQHRLDAQASLDDLRVQLNCLRDEAKKQLKGLAEDAAAQEDALNGTRRGLGDVASAIGKAQAAAEEAAAEGARLQAFAEAGLSELRRDVRSGAQQAAALDRQLAECREEVLRQSESAREQALKISACAQKDANELSRRLETAEQAHEEQATRCRDQLRELSRSLGDRLSDLEGRMQNLSEQSDLGLISVRHEMARVAGAAQDLAPDLEQACRRIVGEEAHAQVEKFTDAMEVHKQASADALAAAVAEPRTEVKALRLALSEQEAESAARFERLASETQRQGRNTSSKLKQELEDMSVAFEERLSAVSANTRQIALEQRQEVARQLQPMAEKLNEVSNSTRAARRVEAELGTQCERLVLTTEELCAGQEALSLQTNDTAQNLNSLRSEIRSIGCRDVAVTWAPSALNSKTSGEREGRRSLGHASGSSETHQVSSGSGGWTALTEPITVRRSDEQLVPAASARAQSRSRSQSPVTAPAPSLEAYRTSQERPAGVQSLPPSSHGATPGESTAFSRLGELRRRLGTSPASAPAPASAPVEANPGSAAPALSGGPWGGGLQPLGRGGGSGATLSPPTSPSQGGVRPPRGRGASRPPNLLLSREL
eukprot:TRINITY_DN76820_c0_g1_i1.p1 TRINITY_DN76820_c0_g1~~TRINITY_DN76820_c0_g1_i1.p1  ORF type:complete len:1048 (-),score=252.89 TRINITY_DN76820_c0_g1_i1:33-2999(-)